MSTRTGFPRADAPRSAGPAVRSGEFSFRPPALPAAEEDPAFPSPSPDAARGLADRGHGWEGSRTPARVRACLAVLVIAVFATLFAGNSSRALAQGGTESATWAQVAQEVSQGLDDGLTEYRSGDVASAAADMQKAYNSSYVATNLAKVVADTLGQDSYRKQTQQFTDIQRLAYRTGNEAELSSTVQSLSSDLADSASKLDADASLPSPAAYAAQRAEQTQQERARIDAEKTKKNAGKGDQTWSAVADQMNAILDRANVASASGDGRRGSDLVNEAYYQYYEKLGFEKTVMTAISGQRVSQVENQFKESRKAMVASRPSSEIKGLIDELKNMVTQDAKVLDGGAGGNVNPVAKFFSSSFGQAFIIIVREGLEAILVVAAIIAYLVKSGHRDKLKYIYWGILAGLVASGLMALLFTFVVSAAGSHQEILEGATALVAMVMLLFTSNWLLSKSSVSAWNSYIKDKTLLSLSAGGIVSMASLSFLAVFREGAETVMFYQALFGMSAGSAGSIWLGFGVGCLVLLAVFCLIRFTSVKIPIRPFFVVTSALMALMVVIFAGGGLHELIEADVVNGTYIPGLPTNDYLGIYPYRETVIFQAVMAVVVIAFAITSTVVRKRTTRPAAGDEDGTAAAAVTVAPGAEDPADEDGRS